MNSNFSILFNKFFRKIYAYEQKRQLDEENIHFSSFDSKSSEIINDWTVLDRKLCQHRLKGSWYWKIGPPAFNMGSCS